MHGIVADGGASGAGTFTALLAKLLERGHEVHFFGVPGFTEPRSLGRFANYRFVDVNTPHNEAIWLGANRLPTEYPRAAAAQICLLVTQREAVKRVAAANPAYDLLLCTDAQQLWPAPVPVISWPQSPPHTEAAILRTPHLAPTVIERMGLLRYAAIQTFYAYRAVAARAALGCSDLYICGSSWALGEWQRFGAAPERLRQAPYPVDLRPFADVPTAPAPAGGGTFLWLGRSVPRKRLDLFLEAFALLRQRRPGIVARIVGNVAADRFARPLLAKHAGQPGITIEPAVTRADVPSIFATSDVLVQPSESENFGFAVAEALAAGRPVVVGSSNGTRDYVGAAGYPFDEYRAEAVAEAMDRALTAVSRDPAAVAAAARATAGRYFALDSVAGTFEALCGELISRAS